MITLDGASVTYPNGVTALKPTSLTFRKGEFLVLLGKSGAGKSTLLRCLNGLVQPTTGRVAAEGLGDLRDAAVLRAHRRRTGMIFQHHQLIGRLSALDNVLTGRLGHHSFWRTLLPMPGADKRIALDCLDRVGLSDRALTRADQLSGGQQQRVGIARALAQQPTLILADEPVASLDPANAVAVLSRLREICTADGISAVVSLHQVDLARRFADRIVGVAGGAVVAEATADTLTPGLVRDIYDAPPERVAPPAAPLRPTLHASAPQPAFLEASR